MFKGLTCILFGWISFVTCLEDVNMRIESGAIKIDDYRDVSYFYTLVMKRDTERECLILWINGGLGVSSYLGYFMGIGPFLIDDSNNTRHNDFTWFQMCDLLVVDNPIGTGMSQSRENVTFKDYSTMNFYMVAFVRKVLEKHSQYTSMLLAGESLGSRVISRLALSFGEIEGIDLRGVVLVSPFVNPTDQYSEMMRFFLDKGLVKEEEKDQYSGMIDECIEGLVDEGKIDGNLVDLCFAAVDQILHKGVYKYNIDFNNQSNIYINGSRFVQKMFQSGEVSKYINYMADTSFYRYSQPKIAALYKVENFKDEIPVLKKILDSGIRLHVISGGLDIISHYYGTFKSLQKLSETASTLDSNDFTHFTTRNPLLTYSLYKHTGHFACFQEPYLCQQAVTSILNEQTIL